MKTQGDRHDVETSKRKMTRKEDGTTRRPDSEEFPIPVSPGDTNTTRGQKRPTRLTTEVQLLRGLESCSTPPDTSLARSREVLVGPGPPAVGRTFHSRRSTHTLGRELRRVNPRERLGVVFFYSRK